MEASIKTHVRVDQATMDRDGTVHWVAAEDTKSSSHETDDDDSFKIGNKSTSGFGAAKPPRSIEALQSQKSSIIAQILALAPSDVPPAFQEEYQRLKAHPQSM